MAAIHQPTPPCTTSFAMYDDHESERFPAEHFGEHVAQEFLAHHADPDEAIPSIEEVDRNVLASEQHAVSYPSQTPTSERAKSRRTSAMTSTSFISSLPSELSIASKPVAPAKYGYEAAPAHVKPRPLFRNPASVRAMQMSSPPPLPSFDSPHDRVKGGYQFTTPSRNGRSETPMSASGSRRSGSRRGSIYRASHEPPMSGSRLTPTPQQHLPLVLLHVTILPMQIPYPPELMNKVMPQWLVENYKLLEEKLQDMVLMQRGLLIAHPNDEYDLLEERILESLELRTPRLLKCGHFVGAVNDGSEDSDADDCASSPSDETGRGSRMSGGTIAADDEDDTGLSDVAGDFTEVCADCHRQVKKPGKGVGSGKKRWDLKVYAANGLMRAGAWSAAWKEMERCDVEISPWIPEDVKSEVQKKVEEEQERQRQKMLYEAEVQRLVDRETARLKELELRAEEAKELENDQQIVRAGEEAEMEAREVREHELKELLEATFASKMEEIRDVLHSELEVRLEASSGTVAERFGSLEKGLKDVQQSIAVWVPPVQSQPSIPGPPPFMEGTHIPPQYASSEIRRSRQDETIPLGTLLRNYLIVVAKDQRNVALVVLVAVLVYLLQHTTPAPYTYQPSVQLHSLERQPTTALAPLPVITSTATLTEVSVATTTATTTATATVTRVEYLPMENVVELPQETEMASVEVGGRASEDASMQHSVAPTHEPNSSKVETGEVNENVRTHAPKDERNHHPSSTDIVTAVVESPTSTIVSTSPQDTGSSELPAATPERGTGFAVSPAIPVVLPSSTPLQSAPPASIPTPDHSAPYCARNREAPLTPLGSSTDADTCQA